MDASGVHADSVLGSAEPSMLRDTEEILRLIGGMELLEPPLVSGSAHPCTPMRT